MDQATTTKFKLFHLFLLASFFAVLLWSVINPVNRIIWLLEVAPVIAILFGVLITYRRFELSALAYFLIWLVCILILLGAHYTYDKVPVFNWLKTSLNLSRNHFDRLIHFTDGFVGALVIREILLRRFKMFSDKQIVLIITGIILAGSAAYELLEWGIAAVGGRLGQDYLGMQGDIWDTQWDMFVCLCGAVLALVGLSRLQERYLLENHRII
ncbi:MAG TPA: DUF2238 domain-containing protein [Desulfobacteria bacterium]|nr:DUF2238 domain-containing protein [Desulfobacteria bacterium]